MQTSLEEREMSLNNSPMQNKVALEVYSLVKPRTLIDSLILILTHSEKKLGYKDHKEKKKKNRVCMPIYFSQDV